MFFRPSEVYSGIENLVGMVLNLTPSTPRAATIKPIGNIMTRWIHIGVVAFCVVCAVACSADKPKELLETAEFEERQTNVPHAKQLYEDVIRLYPTSKEAAIARTRLDALKKAP